MVEEEEGRGKRGERAVSEGGIKGGRIWRVGGK